jgi:uridine phosphorylase
MKPHIHLEPSPRYERVIVCGAPERAKFFSSFLKAPQSVAQNREYHSYLGQHNGKDVLIMSHGVGSAGAAIAFQELIDVGAKQIIRIGTAGGLQDDSQIAEIVVPSAAVRKDGVSPQMIPLPFPAIADPELFWSLNEGFKKKNFASKPGIIVTGDIYYPGPLPTELELYRDAGAVAVEMECATLFVIGSLRKVKTAAIVVLDGNPLKWNHGHFDNSPERLKASMEKSFQVAVDTLTS